MANKRVLKKQIRYVCGDIASECIFAQENFNGIDTDKMTQVILKVAVLQEDTVKKISVDFDKKPKEFKGNLAEYKSARAKYFKAMTKSLIEHLKNEIDGIVAEMNALVPQAQKDAIKEALAE